MNKFPHTLKVEIFYCLITECNLAPMLFLYWTIIKFWLIMLYYPHSQLCP